MIDEYIYVIIETFILRMISCIREFYFDHITNVHLIWVVNDEFIVVECGEPSAAVQLVSWDWLANWDSNILQIFILAFIRLVSANPKHALPITGEGRARQ